MKRSTISNLNHLFLLLTAIGFLALFIILSYNNRLASDDLYFLAMIKKEGLWNCFKGVYMGWSGRWIRTAYWFFVMTITNNYQHIHYFLFAYHLITLLLFILSIQFIMRSLFFKLFKLELTKKDAFIFSTLFLASFYFFTFDIIESWWWICSSFAYLQGICFLLAGTALLLKQKQSLLSYCGIGFCFLYVGGCFEIYSLIVLGLFAGCIVYGKRTGKWEEWKEKRYSKAFFIALACLIISTIICFVAPGNYQRRGVIGEENIVRLPSLSADVHLAITFLLQKKLGVAILLSILWMLLGMKLRENPCNQLSYQKVKNVLLVGLVAIAGSILINIIFKMFFLKNALMPARTFTFTSFSIAAFMCLLFLVLGYYFFNKAKWFTLVVPLLPCCTMIILFAYIGKQYESTTRYAKQHDALIDTLLLAKAHAEKEVVVNALPDPGMLLQLNVEQQSWTLQEILDLSYEIRVEK